MGNQLHCSVQTYWNGAVALICTFIHFVLFDRSLLKSSEFTFGLNNCLTLVVGRLSSGSIDLVLFLENDQKIIEIASLLVKEAGGSIRQKGDIIIADNNKNLF